MVCLVTQTRRGAAGWKAQTNPPSYGGTPKTFIVVGKCPNIEQITWPSGHTEVTYGGKMERYFLTELST